MPNYAKTIVMGHVGRDPESRFTTEGSAVCNFSVAYSEKVKGQDSTTWYRVSCFGKTAEVAGEYVRKGAPVMVEGRMREREWQDKDGNKRTQWELMCDRLVLLGSRQDGNAQSAPAQRKATPKMSAEDADREIPFAPHHRGALSALA